MQKILAQDSSQREWIFLGVPVCLRAWKNLHGIGWNSQSWGITLMLCHLFPPCRYFCACTASKKAKQLENKIPTYSFMHHTSLMMFCRYPVLGRNFKISARENFSWEWWFGAPSWFAIPAERAATNGCPFIEKCHRLFLTGNLRLSCGNSSRLPRRYGAWWCSSDFLGHFWWLRPICAVWQDWREVG